MEYTPQRSKTISDVRDLKNYSYSFDSVAIKNTALHKRVR